MLATAAVVLGAFVIRETRTPDPLVAFSIFRIRTVAGANVAGLILEAALFSQFLITTLYMQQVLGYSPTETGLAYLAVAGTAVVWANASARLVTRIGVKPVLVAGMVALTAGNLQLTQLSVGGSYAADLLPGFLLIGFGIGFAFVPISDRRARRCRRRAGRARIRAYQHVVADRRRDRHRGPVHRRRLGDQRRARRRHAGSGGAHRRVPGRDVGRNGGGRRRPRRRARAHPAPRARARGRPRDGGRMSAFTARELGYLRGRRRLARVATVGRDGTPHVVPVGWTYNAEHDTIDIGGSRLEQTKKYRDVVRSGRAAVVIDDIESVDPWKVRGVEVRGRAEPVERPWPLIRIHPERIVSWGLG